MRSRVSVAVAVVVALLFVGLAVWLLRPPAQRVHGPAGPEGRLVLLHAGSLTAPFEALAKAYRARHPGAELLREACGSRLCARKISELGRRVDVFGSADYKVIDDLLVPRFARYNIRFTTNDLVIASTARSRRREEMNESTWPRILSDPEVRFGRSDPDSDPCGYRTLMMFQLAERHYGEAGLAERLTAMHGRTFIRPKETDLLALLDAGEIDYLPIYRSVAVQHGLPFVDLPPQIDLGDPSLADLYRNARVEVIGETPGSRTTLVGEPIVYSVTIPTSAPNPAGAEAFVAFLLSEEGRRIIDELGQPPLVPPVVSGRDALPALLRQVLGPGVSNDSP
jgi:molybdate/tungstate transport system substrate-binding protein